MKSQPKDDPPPAKRMRQPTLTQSYLLPYDPNQAFDIPTQQPSSDSDSEAFYDSYDETKVFNKPTTVSTTSITPDTIRHGPRVHSIRLASRDGTLRPTSLSVKFEQAVDIKGPLPIVFEYIDLYFEPKFVKQFHLTLVGKMVYWREKNMNVLDEMMCQQDIDHCKVVEVKDWLMETVREAELGILAHTQSCVAALSKQVLVGCIKGFKTYEIATLVNQITFSNKFELFFEPNLPTNDFRLITQFDDDIKRRFEFGRGNYFAA
jgi:hypothetical protein